MIVAIQIAKYKNWKWILGLFSMPILHTYLFLNQKKYAFAKLMGVGKNGTFDIQPDLHQWVCMLTFNNLNELDNYKKHSFLKKYHDAFSEEIKYIILEPFQLHGCWDKKQPFIVNDHDKITTSKTHSGKIAVLTRATIKPMKAISFWKNVPQVAQSMAKATGLRFSIGMGEMPFFKQATLSIWDSENQMKAFAYRQADHKEVINKTRIQGWYSEEMFIRFKVLSY